jgi:hypothetical protein
MKPRFHLAFPFFAIRLQNIRRTFAPEKEH